MMLGAILDSETPLRQRIKYALNLNLPLAADNKSKAWHANLIGVGRHSMAVLTGSTWIAAVLSFAICLIAAAAALHVLDADAERRVLDFMDRHRLLLAGLIL